MARKVCCGTGVAAMACTVTVVARCGRGRGRGRGTGGWLLAWMADGLLGLAWVTCCWHGFPQNKQGWNRSWLNRETQARRHMDWPQQWAKAGLRWRVAVEATNPWRRHEGGPVWEEKRGSGKACGGHQWLPKVEEMGEASGGGEGGGVASQWQRTEATGQEADRHGRHSGRLMGVRSVTVAASGVRGKGSRVVTELERWLGMADWGAHTEAWWLVEGWMGGDGGRLAGFGEGGEGRTVAVEKWV